MKVLLGSLVAAVLLSLLIGGCLSGPLTLEGYAEVVCQSQAELGELEPSTMGEAEEGFTGLYEDMESVTPPEELGDYHATQLALVKYFLDYSKEQDADSELDFSAAIRSTEFQDFATAFREAWYALENETREMLESSGCDTA